MPFILPTAIMMYKMKQLQSKPSYLRINFLKNIYYTRLFTYANLLLIYNLN